MVPFEPPCYTNEQGFICSQERLRELRSIREATGYTDCEGDTTKRRRFTERPRNSREINTTSICRNMDIGTSSLTFLFLSLFLPHLSSNFLSFFKSLLLSSPLSNLLSPFSLFPSFFFTPSTSFLLRPPLFSFSTFTTLLSHLFKLSLTSLPSSSTSLLTILPLHCSPISSFSFINFLSQLSSFASFNPFYFSFSCLLLSLSNFSPTLIYFFITSLLHPIILLISSFIFYLLSFDSLFFNFFLSILTLSTFSYYLFSFYLLSFYLLPFYLLSSQA